MANEFQIGSHTYTAGKLGVIPQFHIVRRLAPVLAGLGESLKGNSLASLKEDPLGAALPIVDALSKMSDEDSEYVLNTCLAVVQRKMPGTIGWGAVYVPGGGIMFEDITLVETMQLTWKVLEANVMGFSDALQVLISGAEGADQS